MVTHARKLGEWNITGSSSVSVNISMPSEKFLLLNCTAAGWVSFNNDYVFLRGLTAPYSILYTAKDKNKFWGYYGGEYPTESYIEFPLTKISNSGGTLSCSLYAL